MGFPGLNRPMQPLSLAWGAPCGPARLVLDVLLSLLFLD